MSKEGLKNLLKITQVVQIIKKCGLSSNTEIKNILKMAWRNYTSVDVFSNTQMREDGMKQRE